MLITAASIVMLDDKPIRVLDAARATVPDATIVFFEVTTKIGMSFTMPAGYSRFLDRDILFITSP